MARHSTIPGMLLAVVGGVLVVGISACYSGEPASTAQTFVRVDGRPSNVIVGAGSVWVLDRDSGVVSKIDPSSKIVQMYIPTGVQDGTALTLRDNTLWVSGRTTSATIDITTDAVAVSAGRAGVSVGDRAFAMGIGSERLVELDALTGVQRSVVVLPVLTSTNAQPDVLSSPFATSRGSLYLQYYSEVGPALGRYDPMSGSLTFLSSVGAYQSIAVAGSTVWLLDADRSLRGYDATTGKPLAVRAGTRPSLPPVDQRLAGLDDDQVSLVVAADGTMWALDQPAQFLYQLDPATGQAISSTHLRYRPSSLLVLDDSVWINNTYDTRITEVDRRHVQLRS